MLAAATALPEISSGIAAVRLGDHQLAIGDILGSNSFQITLFLLADLLAGTPVIVAARHSDVWLGGAGLLMTAVAAAAVIARPKRTFLWLGIDSFALIAIYAGVIAFLPHVTQNLPGTAEGHADLAGPPAGPTANAAGPLIGPGRNQRSSL